MGTITKKIIKLIEEKEEEEIQPTGAVSTLRQGTA